MKSDLDGHRKNMSSPDYRLQEVFNYTLLIAHCPVFTKPLQLGPQRRIADADDGMGSSHLRFDQGNPIQLVRPSIDSRVLVIVFTMFSSSG